MSDLERLDATIRFALGLPLNADLHAIGYGTTDGWDSLGHMQLVEAIEAEFGISVSPGDVFAMSDYQAIREVVGGQLHGSITPGSHGGTCSRAGSVRVPEAESD